MLLALKMDNVVRDNVHTEDVRQVSQKDSLEHSVTDMKTAQEKEKPLVVSGLSRYNFVCAILYPPFCLRHFVRAIFNYCL